LIIIGGVIIGKKFLNKKTKKENITKKKVIKKKAKCPKCHEIQIIKGNSGDIIMVTCNNYRRKAKIRFN
jgi:hypothetical protein